MSGQVATTAAPPAKVNHRRPPAPMRPVTGLSFGIAVAVSALAAGAGLVGASVSWVPSRGDAQALSRGARVYAAECASCHSVGPGERAARTQPGVRGPTPAPPLDATGHTWRHSDTELAGIVARGAGGVDPSGSTSVMPAFAERLNESEIDDILAYVKSRWPADIHAYQATLNSGGGLALSALLRDPAWTFPAQCLSPPAVTDAP